MATLGTILPVMILEYMPKVWRDYSTSVSSYTTLVVLRMLDTNSIKIF